MLTVHQKEQEALYHRAQGVLLDGYPTVSMHSCRRISGKASIALLHGFVQELICCSCTSGTALQTTLCYIEAVRQKLPKITSTPVALVNETTPFLNNCVDACHGGDAVLGRKPADE